MSLIAEEIEKARKQAEAEARREAAARKKANEKADKTSAATTTAKPKSTPLESYSMSKADRELSGSFANNRGSIGKA